MKWRLSERVDLGASMPRLGGGARDAAQDAERQRLTAGEILRRFDERPGVVLADEVGMGKTFVALAVAVSVVEATGHRAPVVVMVPPSVRGKWPREWRRFEAALRPGPPIRAAQETVTSASDFLKLLDDPDDRRAHVIFLTHRALHNTLADPWVKLYIVRRALSARRLTTQRALFPRWADRVVGGLKVGPETCEQLMRTPVNHWRRRITALTGRDPGDDPVPRALVEAVREVDLGPLRDVLTDLPKRSSPNIQQRLRILSRTVSTEVRDVWRACIAQLDLELPLLVLDEAHHTKNPGTQLSGLFANEQAREDLETIRGPFGGVFDRMLFLTATPFQLGHNELIEVLRRFTAVHWGDLHCETYERELDDLNAALDAMQASALRLDRAWGHLSNAALDTSLSPAWWDHPDAPELTPELQAVAATWVETRARTKRAEHALRPFVIRHLRADRDARREILCGRAIASLRPEDQVGVQVAGPAVLPFLLAARAQALVAMHGLRAHSSARAVFADGLASSFEAYRSTRTAGSDDLDDVAAPEAGVPDEIGWYLDRIERALPEDGTHAFLGHPKVAATVERAVSLWLQREKIVIFCFFRATGRALRAHISRAIEQETVRLAGEQMGIDSTEREEIERRLELVRDRLFDPSSPARQYAEQRLQALLRQSLPDAHVHRAAELALRFLRTRSFLVRYADLGSDAQSVMEAAFDKRDASDRPFADVVSSFGEFIAGREESERNDYLDRLSEIEVGDIRVRDDEAEHDRAGLLANVRLVNGAVAQPVRERLMIAFNTPFFPEVLVASAVMAEGVDLHRNCRYVIHHDLDWNPSVIEQRTGRLDRIDSKGEASGWPVVVFEPFVEGTQDEKQFRVMKDRERWFNVVLGEHLALDEWATDWLAERPDFPTEAAARLTMDLSVARPARA